MFLANSPEVVGEGEPGLVGHRVRRDRILPAQHRRIDAELVGGDVDHALDDIGRLGTAVAAIGAHRIGVGQHRRHVHVHRRRLVDARERAEIAHEGLPADLQERADIGDEVDAQSQEMAVIVERELGFGDVVACLAVREERLRARADPFHRPAGDLGRPQHQRRLVVDRALHPERAADVAGHDAHLVLGDFEHELAELFAEGEVALQRGVDGVVIVIGTIDADGAARLHAGGGHAVDHEAMLDDLVGLGEGGIGLGLVAFEMHEADVVRAVVPNQRRARLDRFLGGDDRGQRLVVDLDQLGRVGGLMRRFGHHERDIVADPADAVARQRAVARLIEGRAVTPLRAGRHREIAEAGIVPVLAGEHGEHAGCGLGLGDIDALDARMRVRRAQHVARHGAGKHHVADVVALAPDQPRIFEPRDRLTYSPLTRHCSPLPLCSECFSTERQIASCHRQRRASRACETMPR